MATKEEYHAVLAEMAQKPESIPTAMLTLRDYIEADTTAITSLQSELKSVGKQVAELQAANAKLYLESIATKPAEGEDTGHDDEEDETIDPDAAFDDLIKEELSYVNGAD